MSSEATHLIIPAAGHSSVIDKEAAPHRMYVYSACTILAIVWNYFAGKEMAWDLLNYHFYAGFSALNDRFELDYFAAGIQSYFNPYAYVPFYALVKLGLPGLAVGTVLAMIHSAVLWITFELACCVWSSENRKELLFFGSCVTVLAFINPILLQQIGSSFSDITTTGLVLGGWLLLIQAVKFPRASRVLFGAVLLGVATALKPTNSVHAVAGFFVVAFVPLPFLGRIRNLFYFGTALGISFVLTAAPWSYRLARQFGNPMFPLLNNVFKSPEYTTAPLKHYRFIPDSLIDALQRPFDMVGRANMIHDELSAPDIRYALLLLVFLISIIAWLWRSNRGKSDHVAGPRTKSTTRALAALGCGFAFDWIVWLVDSGNSRYFIPMACIAAVLAVALLFRLLKNHTAGRNAILLVLLVAQGFQLSLVAVDTSGRGFRWNQAPWKGPWFDVVTPDGLANHPNLYLSIGMEANAFVAPFLAQGSGLVNFAGGYSLGPDGANATRVRAMIARSAPHLRVLVSGDQLYQDSALRLPRESDVHDALRTFGLRVEMSDCETITLHGLRPVQGLGPWRPLASSLPLPTGPITRLPYTSHLVSCQVVADNRDESREIADRRTADVVLDRLEESCPALFQPARPQTQHINRVWLRVYSATDLTAWIGNGEVKFIDPTRDPHDIVVGREEEWERRPLPLECGRRRGIYFARLAQAGK
jgi:hypothetical protein